MPAVAPGLSIRQWIVRDDIMRAGMSLRERSRSGPHLARKGVTREVADAICRILRSGRYHIGGRLPSEQELGEEFQASRSAVREAVRELITLDLLEIRPGRGTFVKSLRPDLLFRPDSLGDSLNEHLKWELLEVRRIMEPQAAALAAERATADELARLEHDVEILSQAIGQGFRPPEDLAFHLDLVRATHNASLLRVSGVIISFYDRDGTLPSERDAIEHREIFEAIRARDASRALALMLAHLKPSNDKSE
jgi:GntR family transcriptional repressor for pyruvate dehydrogenase complex